MTRKTLMRYCWLFSHLAALMGYVGLCVISILDFIFLEKPAQQPNGGKDGTKLRAVATYVLCAPLLTALYGIAIHLGGMIYLYKIGWRRKRLTYDAIRTHMLMMGFVLICLTLGLVSAIISKENGKRLASLICLVANVLGLTAVVWDEYDMRTMPGNVYTGNINIPLLPRA
ncbi:hypothetical protein F4825DRAFT_448744 [Nemania diffusa]|nr:hypothetical protein F4825DRAFT_448744 [Nemania diffusa]